VVARWSELGLTGKPPEIAVFEAENRGRMTDDG
jgi:hypothetical protein